MMCPICGAHTVVKETRDSRRRRECFNLHKFSTHEVVIEERAFDWRDVASHPGKATQVASHYSISVNHVYAYRSRLRDEQRSSAMESRNLQPA